MPPYIFRCASVIHTARTSALWGLQLLLLLRQTANGALAITSTTYICILQFLSGRSHNASGLCSRGREVFSVPHSTLWSLWVKPSRYSQYTDFRQKWVCTTWWERVQTQHRFPSSTLQTIACRLIYEVYCVAVIWRSPRTFLFNTNRKRLSVFHHLAAIKKWL